MDPRREAEDRVRDAEREVRCGNFRGALAIFRELAAADPTNEHYARRIASLEENLQPMELSHPKAAPGGPARADLSDLQRAEAAANEGDLATAIACYERVVSAAPENELARDRLEELRAELRAQVPPPSPEPPPPARASTSTAKENDASLPVSELDSPAVPPPSASKPAAPTAREATDPIARLEQVLERIRRRRRKP